jgi:hypothetical protein
LTLSEQGVSLIVSATIIITNVPNIIEK